MPHSPQPTAIELYPTKIVFQTNRDGNDEVYVMNADGTGQSNLTNNSGVDGWPDWQVKPNQPPNCSAAEPSLDTLWPPNHQFEAINVLGVIDPEGDPLSLTITSIFQDEAVDAEGSGNTSPDGQGVGTSTTEVRAERVGSGNGRVYHISFSADDGHGGSCSGEVVVGVPKSQGKNGGPIDDGPLFDSTVTP